MKTTKITTLLLVTVLAIGTAYAQPPNDKQKMKEKMESARIGMITTKLDLTSEQAKEFWPVYNEYRKKQDDIRSSMRQLKKKEMKTEDDYKKTIDQMIKNKEAELNLEKEYKDKFLKVISAKQLVELYKAEREFKMMLLHKLEGRKPPKNRPEGHRPPGPHPPMN